MQTGQNGRWPALLTNALSSTISIKYIYEPIRHVCLSGYGLIHYDKRAVLGKGWMAGAHIFLVKLMLLFLMVVIFYDCTECCESDASD